MYNMSTHQLPLYYQPQLSNLTLSETMFNMSAHQLPQYYQLQLSNITLSETMYNMSTHQLPLYYQPQLSNLTLSETMYNWTVFTRYALRAARQIFLFVVEQDLKSQAFRPTWPCLIVEVLATSVKFFQPSGYCTSNVFGCFRGIITYFELIKHKFPIMNTLYVHLCSFQITQSEAMNNMSAYKLRRYY